MISVIAACLLFSGMLQGCAGGANSRIVNGIPFKIEDVPYEAAILLNGGPICGGSIISAQHILSAAHCFTNLTVDQITVRTGSNSSISDGFVSSVSQIISHPQHGVLSIFDYDIAVLILETQLQFNQYTKAIILSSSKATPGKKVLVTGWGQLSSADHPVETTLQGGYTEILSRKMCRKLIVSRITVGKFCTRDNKDLVICSGDSGGPVATKMGHQIGISSYSGKGCFAPSVYTNIPAYRSFIDEATDNKANWSLSKIAISTAV